MERSAVLASKGERRGMWRTGTLPSLKLNVHFAVSGYRQPFLPLFCWLFGSDSLQGCQTLLRTKRERRQGVENGQGGSCNKHLTAEEAEKIVYDFVTHHCGQRIPQQSSPSLSHVLFLPQRLANIQITGEYSHSKNTFSSNHANLCP